MTHDGDVKEVGGHAAGDAAPLTTCSQPAPSSLLRNIDESDLRSHSAFSFDVSKALSEFDGTARRESARRSASELDIDALRHVTMHGSGARSQPMLNCRSVLREFKGVEEKEDQDAACPGSGSEEPSSSGVDDPLPQLSRLGRLGDDFQPNYGTAPRAAAAGSSPEIHGSPVTAAAVGLEIGTASSPAQSATHKGAASGPSTDTLRATTTDDEQTGGGFPQGDGASIEGQDAEADDEDDEEEDLRIPGANLAQKHPFATVVINGYQLLRCHFPSFHRETTSRAFPLHQNSEAVCKAGHRFRFVCYTHYSCPKSYNIRARVIMDGKPGEPSVEVDLGILRPKTDIMSTSHTLPFSPSTVRFTLKKMNVNHGFSAELESQLVDLVERMALAEIDTQGYGSLSAFQVQCRFEDTEIYREIVGRKYNNSWHRFLMAHRDRFNTFYYTREEISKSNLYPYAKFHEERILIRGKESSDFKDKDRLKAQERNQAERSLLDRIELILRRSPDGWVDEHELLRFLQQDQSFLAFLSPVYSALMRFMRRHRDQFVWVTQPFLPTKFGLKETKGDEAKELDAAKKNTDAGSAGGPKIPSVTIRHPTSKPPQPVLGPPAPAADAWGHTRKKGKGAMRRPPMGLDASDVDHPPPQAGMQGLAEQQQQQQQQQQLQPAQIQQPPPQQQPPLVAQVGASMPSDAQQLAMAIPGLQQLPGQMVSFLPQAPQMTSDMTQQLIQGAGSSVGQQQQPMFLVMGGQQVQQGVPGVALAQQPQAAAPNSAQPPQFVGLPQLVPGVQQYIQVPMGMAMLPQQAQQGAPTAAC